MKMRMMTGSIIGSSSGSLKMGQPSLNEHKRFFSTQTHTHTQRKKKSITCSHSLTNGVQVVLRPCVW